MQLNIFKRSGNSPKIRFLTSPPLSRNGLTKNSIVISGSTKNCVVIGQITGDTYDLVQARHYYAATASATAAAVAVNLTVQVDL